MDSHCLKYNSVPVTTWFYKAKLIFYFVPVIWKHIIMQINSLKQKQFSVSVYADIMHIKKQEGKFC